MWKGRFQKDTAEIVRDFTESISFDQRLYAHDIEGSVAHAAALQRAGLITAEEERAIAEGLRQIGTEIARGEFSFDPALEDIHMNIEAELTRRIGPAGAKLHTARSRNDQVALDLRLWLRDEIRHLQEALRTLQRALVTLAAKHPQAVMPGYTHLQRAQPVLLGHHLLAYVEMFDRDHGRFEDAFARANVLPLGSGALAGSTINLDREFLASQLGFPKISRNSMDAVSDRDPVCEVLAAAAVAGMHLSRLSEDLVLWTSTEFQFITMSDAFATGSSLMPQKKNPDVAELTRGKTGRLYGNLVAVLTTLKGLPLTYNRDLQEDKEALFDSTDTLRAALAVTAAMLADTTVHETQMAAAAADPALLATDLADYLVQRGLPFREAHGVVGRAVSTAHEKGVGLDRLSLEEWRALSPLITEDVRTIFDVRRALAARTNPGAPSPANVAAELSRWREILGL
jgi:argininosuccinate lyase